MKELELYDIYGTWHVPFWQTRFFLMALSAIAALLALLLGWAIYKKYYKAKSIPLAQQLLLQLNQLRSRVITNTQDAQHAYMIMTDALKRYFQDYYAKPFTVLSDLQVQQELATHVIPYEYSEPLKKLLDESVFVKFAQEHALQEQVNAHVQLCITIINHLESTRKSS